MKSKAVGRVAAESATLGEGDATPGPRDPRPLSNSARLAAFAFAASDLLAEVTLDGRVTFAAGAYRTRLGAAPEAFVGGRVQRLVAPADRVVLGQALASLAARGRLAPIVLRLADAAATPVCVSGLAQPGPGESWRLCLAFGPLPAPRPPEAAPAPAVVLTREAAERAGEGGTGVGQRLDLVEIKRLPDLPPEELSAIVADALRGAAGGGALVGEIAPGRYGLLRDHAEAGAEAEAGAGAVAETGADTGAGEAAAQRLARAAAGALLAGGIRCEVEAHSLALGAADGIGGEGVRRALRCALAAFARDGWAAVADAGFEQGLSGFLSKSLGRRADILRRIAERRFDLVFQPIVSLEDRALHHHEALLRLPGVGGEGTQEFALAAEAAGLAVELDSAVLDMALERAAAAAPGTVVAVNVSVLSLQSPAFRAGLLRRLDADPFAAGRLAIEVTETAELDSEGEAAATAEALRARGVAFCIDDFGAGSAAFRHLRTLRADIVKVDGAYVRGAARSERDRAFVAAMVDLSLAVGAKVVAEQVETEEEAAVMQSLGVTYGQGWLFGRPGRLPAPAAAAEPPRAAPRKVLLAATAAPGRTR